MLSEYIRGFYYFLSGFSLIRQRSLLKFVWIPLLCNILLFSLMLVFAGYGFNAFGGWIDKFLPSWLQWLHWVIVAIGVIASAIVLAFVSTFLVNLIAGPFNSLLAEKVIRYFGAEKGIVPISMMRAVPAAFRRQMQFLGYYLPRAIVYLLLFIVPVVQIAAAVLWFLFNAWVFTLQYLDYAMDLNGISIDQMKQQMKRRSALCLGFGSGVVLFAMIPLINLMVVPVAVVGATALWVKEFRGAST